ncbi:5340_t:CDS:2, partial [Paraglomus occultum]
MVLRLRLLRPLFYRPLWPQRRLSSSLISKCENDLLSIIAELPEDSKAIPKIANLIVAMVMDFEEAKQREIMALLEERRQETKEMTKHMKDLEIDVKTRTESLLRSRRMCNVRGALEFIGSTIRSQDKTISFREPTDNILMGLTKDTKFVSILQQTCSLNNFQYKDVEKCMGGLYHTASKKLHGHETDIEINARDWSVNE